MAIRIISGVPRSGKTYYAVNHLYKTYFTVSGKRKEKYKDLKIVSNIDSLSLPHENLNEWLAAYDNDPKKLFSYENQEKIFKKHGRILYFIDEAQVLFPDTFKSDPVGNWLQLHGHFGQDIYLLTQDVLLLPRSYGRLAEEIIRAVPRTVSLFSGSLLQYNYINYKGDVISSLPPLRKDQKIFSLYKSQDAKEVQGVRSPMTKILGAAILLVIFVGGYSLYSFFTQFKPKGKSVSGSPVVYSSKQKDSSLDLSSVNSSYKPMLSSVRSLVSPVDVDDVVQFNSIRVSVVNIPKTVDFPERNLYCLGNRIFKKLEQLPYPTRVDALGALYALVPLSDVHLFEPPPPSPSSSSQAPALSGAGASRAENVVAR